MTDQPPSLRDQIAEALMSWAERNVSPQYASLRRPETVRQNAYGRADAVLAVLDAATVRGAARTASGQQPETVPTPEEGIEDARKVIQHVLQLFLDRVPRNELDAETMADSVTDALSDGLTELYRSLAQAETALAAVGQPAEAQAADEAQQLVPVGWWCWRGDNHGHLADIPCRSDNVPIHVPAEWADEMRAVVQHLTDDHDPGEDCTWVTPEEQAAETEAAADTVEDETR